MPKNGARENVSKEADPHPRDSTEPQFTTTNEERKGERKRERREKREER